MIDTYIRRRRVSVSSICSASVIGTSSDGSYILFTAVLDGSSLRAQIKTCHISVGDTAMNVVVIDKYATTLSTGIDHSCNISLFELCESAASKVTIMPVVPTPIVSNNSGLISVRFPKITKPMMTAAQCGLSRMDMVFKPVSMLSYTCNGGIYLVNTAGPLWVRGTIVLPYVTVTTSDIYKRAYGTVVTGISSNSSYIEGYSTIPTDAEKLSSSISYAAHGKLGHVHHTDVYRYAPHSRAQSNRDRLLVRGGVNIDVSPIDDNVDYTSVEYSCCDIRVYARCNAPGVNIPCNTPFVVRLKGDDI